MVPNEDLPNVEFREDSYGEYSYDVTGLEVIKVRQGGPAEEAGLKVGDILVELGGTPIRNMVEFERHLSSNYDPGDEARLTVVRVPGASFPTRITIDEDVFVTLDESPDRY